MAATDALPLPIRGRAYQVMLNVVNFTTGQPITGGLTGEAITVSKDNGAFAARANAPTEIGTTGSIPLLLSASEMTANVVVVNPVFTNANWFHPRITIHPAQPGDFPVNVVAQEGVDVAIGAGAIPSLGIIDQGVMQSCTTAGGVLRAAAAFTDSTLVGSIIQIKGASDAFWQTAAISANALSGDTVTFQNALAVAPTGALFYRIFGTPTAASGGLDAASTRAALGLGSANLDTQLSTIAGYVDTEVAAIKAKTDNLPASPASEATLTTIAGYIDTEVAAIKAKTDFLPSAAAGGAGGLPTVNASNEVAGVQGLTESDIAAIKAKTDQLTFTQTGHVDANIQRINDVLVNGSGVPGSNPWQP